MKHTWILNLSLIATITTSFPASGGSTLPPLALYNRCYAQLTGTRPALADSRTVAVKNGTLDPIAACNALLTSAVLSGNGSTLADINNENSKSVLRTMHQLHSSWMAQNDITTIDNYFSYLGSINLWDPSSPAIYLTRGLLSPTPSFRSALTGNSILIPYRTDNDPATGGDGGLKSDFGFDKPITMAPRGELLGISTIPSFSSTIKYLGVEGSFPAIIHGNAGGGLIGSYTYLSMNAKLLTSFRADGAVAMPRRWARSVFHDLLCRDMPTIRRGDAAEFLISGTAAPFRQSSSCIYCHASMDRMAAVARNMHAVAGVGNNTTFGVDTMNFLTPSAPPEVNWPASADADYFKRPPNGVLYFRNYKGDLINSPVNGIEGLAQEILKQDDTYICAAKRYYEYFTGIRVFIGDIGDPAAPVLSAADKSRRDLVIQMGLKLKQTDNLRQLIQDILALDHYKLSDFGLN